MLMSLVHRCIAATSRREKICRSTIATRSFRANELNRFSRAMAPGAIVRILNYFDAAPQIFARSARRGAARKISFQFA
jgi:hypothetical protein